MSAPRKRNGTEHMTERMKVSHPIGDEWLMAYAAGSLSEGQSILVASHLSYLDDAGERLATAEAAGGAMVETILPDAMSPDALARTLAMLDAPEASGVAPTEKKASASAISGAREAASGGDPLPPPLRAWLGRSVDELRWTPIGPGMKKVNLWRGGPNDQRLWMLRARAGIDIPMHGHSGTELVLVLKGSLEDPHGVFRAGDLEECDGSVVHALRTGEGEECICLALTEGPTRFKGWIARLLQPFTGL